MRITYQSPDLCTILDPTEMNSTAPRASFDAEQEYRAIESTLLETARGRWFLAEHGRRSRRLDSALLEDAIGRLQSSLRQPPALLGTLRGEIEQLAADLEATRHRLTARPASRAAAEGSNTSDTVRSDSLPQALLKATEDMHEIAWGLQDNDLDPQACEALARHASQIYALSRQQALEAGRVKELSSTIEQLKGRITGILDTILYELSNDEVPREPSDETAPDAASA